MNNATSKTFDCVQSVRETRCALSAEIEGMSYEQIVQWLRSRRYSDPVLERLARKAAQQNVAAQPSPERTA